MLHTPSYTALNRCAQEGERWSGGYTNQPNPLSSRRALPPLPRTPPRGAGDINATDPAGLSPSPPRLDRATLPESRPACRVPPALHLRKADGHGLRHELRAGKHAPPPSAEVDAGRRFYRGEGAHFLQELLENAPALILAEDPVEAAAAAPVCPTRRGEPGLHLFVDCRPVFGVEDDGAV